MQSGKRVHETRRTGLCYDKKKLRISSVCLAARFLSALFGMADIGGWLGVGAW